MYLVIYHLWAWEWQDPVFSVWWVKKQYSKWLAEVSGCRRVKHAYYWVVRVTMWIQLTATPGHIPSLLMFQYDIWTLLMPERSQSCCPCFEYHPINNVLSLSVTSWGTYFSDLSLWLMSTRWQPLNTSHILQRHFVLSVSQWKCYQP